MMLWSQPVCSAPSRSSFALPGAIVIRRLQLRFSIWRLRMVNAADAETAASAESPRFSTRAHLVILVAVLLVPVIAIATLLAWRLVTAERQRFEQAALEAARTSVLAVEREIRGLTSTLETLAAIATLREGDLPRFYENALAASAIEGMNIALRDRDSRQIVDTNVPFGGQLPDRTSLLEADQAVLSTGRSTVSDFVVGISDNEPSFAVVVPVRREGEIVYLLSGSPNVERLRAALAVEAGELTQSALIDRKGVVLTSARDPKLAGTPALPDLVSETRGAAEGLRSGMRAGAEPLLVGFAKTTFGWTVTAEAPIASFEAERRRTLVALLLGSLILASLALAAALFVARRITGPMQALATAGTGLGHGEPLPVISATTKETAAIAASLRQGAADLTARSMALAASEARYKTALNVGRIGAWETDLAAGARYWSDEGLALFGLSLPGKVGTIGGPDDEWKAILAPGFSDVRERVQAAIETRDTFQIEYEVITPTGNRLWVMGHGRVVERDPAGKPLRYVNVAADITERKAAERRNQFLMELTETLRSSDGAARVVAKAVGQRFAVSRAGFAIAEEDGCALKVEVEFSNGVVKPALGVHRLADFGAWTASELQAGRTVAVDDVLAHTETSDQAAAYLAIGIRSHVSVPVVEDGRLVATLYLNHHEPRRWTPDDIALLEEVAHRSWSVIERERAEATLAALNASLEARIAAAIAERNRLWAVSEDLFVTASFDGRLHEVSDSWLRTLGYSRERLMSESFEAMIHPEDLPFVRSRLQELLEHKRPVDYENRVRTTSGDWRVIAWRLAIDPSGARLYGVGRDVTTEREKARALEEAQHQLHEAQKMESIGQITGGVAHDFNNLLSAILSNLDLARKRIEDPRIAKLVDGAIKGAERGAALTKRLLAFARKQELKTDVVDVAALFHGMSDLLARSLGPGIRINADLPVDLPMVLVDPNQFELALLNLALNARDAMPTGGVLTVEAEPSNDPPASLKPGAYVRIRVSDTGSGMDAATLKRATEPFFTTKGVGKGTGLGLSMVQGLAAQSAGAIEIESKLGSGTRIMLWLPQAMAPAVEAQPTLMPTTVPAERVGRVVLAVDDDALVLMGTAAILEDVGHTVIEATSGREGLALFDAHPEIEIVITDHAMPGMTGIQLAEALRAKRPDLPIILASGYAELPDGKDPGLPRLAKPFRPEELAAAIESLMVAVPSRSNAVPSKGAKAPTASD
jgi:PAS domain S-box-containing protein